MGLHINRLYLAYNIKRILNPNRILFVLLFIYLPVNATFCISNKVHLSYSHNQKKKNHYSTNVIILVCQGCNGNTSETRGFKQQKLIFSESGGWNLRPMWEQGWFSGRPLSLACKQPFLAKPSQGLFSGLWHPWPLSVHLSLSVP